MSTFCFSSLQLYEACVVLACAYLCTLRIELNLHGPKHLPIVPFLQCLVMMLIPIRPGEVKPNFFTLIDQFVLLLTQIDHLLVHALQLGLLLLDLVLFLLQLLLDGVESSLYVKVIVIHHILAQTRYLMVNLSLCEFVQLCLSAFDLSLSALVDLSLACYFLV